MTSHSFLRATQRLAFNRHALTATCFVTSAATFTLFISGNDGSISNTKLEAGPSSSPSITEQGLSPTSPIYIFRPNSDLEIAFDARTRTPLYVMERLTKTHAKNTTGKIKRPNFYEEKSLPEEFRSRISHYKASGWDRGHMAPASNYANVSDVAVRDTFNLINVCPQNHALNASLWAQLERWTQQVVANECENNKRGEVYVVTGPIWMPSQQVGDKLFLTQYNSIGSPPSLVAVPTHFFKIIVVIQDQTKISKFACFVIPNQDQVESTSSQSNTKKRKTLQEFLVPWSNLEAVTGLHFFPQLTQQQASDDWKARANQLTLDLTTKTSSSNQPLLTAESSSNTTRGGAKRFQSTSSSSSSSLVHLCANGKCQ